MAIISTPRVRPDVWYSRRLRVHMLVSPDGELIRAERELLPLLAWAVAEGIDRLELEGDSQAVIGDIIMRRSER